MSRSIDPPHGHHPLPETLQALAFAKRWARRRGPVAPEEIRRLRRAGFSRREIEGLLAALAARPAPAPEVGEE